MDTFSSSDNNQAEAFNSTPRHLDDLLNFDNPYFKIVSQIHSTKPQLNIANSIDTEPPVWTCTCP